MLIKKQYCHNYLARKGYGGAVFSLVALGSRRSQGPHTGFCVTANLPCPPPAGRSPGASLQLPRTAQTLREDVLSAVKGNPLHFSSIAPFINCL